MKKLLKLCSDNGYSCRIRYWEYDDYYVITFYAKFFTRIWTYEYRINAEELDMVIDEDAYYENIFELVKRNLSEDVARTKILEELNK